MMNSAHTGINTGPPNQAVRNGMGRGGAAALDHNAQTHFDTADPAIIDGGH